MARNIDIIGDIAIVKFPKRTFWIFKKFFAWKLLNKNKSILTVLEKKGDIKGRLRKFDTGFLAGVNKRETIHKENNCRFYLHIDKTYFSPRLSNERHVVSEEIISLVKPNDRILVMFAGVAPFPVVLARFLKDRKIPTKIYSSELNKNATEYAKRNVLLNKLENYIEVLSGDSTKIKIKDKFDFILMPRPNLKETFILPTLKYAKKGTIIYYHGFGTEEKVLKEVKNKKLKIIYIRKAGDIAPRKWRWLVKLEVK